MMPSDDFRYSRHAPRLEVTSKKDDLKVMILRKHPHAENMYRYVRDEFKESFGHVYNNRCAYCGLPLGVVPVSHFEIDHIVCQDVADQDNIVDAMYVHDLKNLAFACSYCNRKKSNFTIQRDSHKWLSPDKGLGQTFVREDDCHIGVSAENADRVDIKQFYDKMNYGSELRRIDYVLSSLIDLRDQVDEKGVNRDKSDVVDCLDATISRLTRKRNRFESQLVRM